MYSNCNHRGYNESRLLILLVFLHVSSLVSSSFQHQSCESNIIRHCIATRYTLFHSMFNSDHTIANMVKIQDAYPIR
ncbi:uncharacterized protein BYT42DRAFT_577472 [Radiomyces spectabilis]|uniref:uncharacterized protein n=1 Tax=Radiomyces spectabilis TaxID=64574 RepID=UPI00221E8118|nr:uncharacterized protein BYT42DRAFT_577472 [Radiomyces spectabilis]KAI8374738.1 hypothetical protein BYT42DRAFT_577472 [Radiomyces spectabilis]